MIGKAKFYHFEQDDSPQKSISKALENISTILSDNSSSEIEVKINSWVGNPSLTNFGFNPCNFIQFINKIVKLEVHGFSGTTSRFDMTLYRAVSKISHSLKIFTFRKGGNIYSSEIAENKRTMNSKDIVEIVSCFTPANATVLNFLQADQRSGRFKSSERAVKIFPDTFKRYFSLLKAKTGLRFILSNNFKFVVVYSKFYYKFLAACCYKLNIYESFKKRFLVASLYLENDELQHLTSLT